MWLGQAILTYVGSCGCVLNASGVMWASCGCMLRVLIWCNVGSCRRVSSVMGVAMVVWHLV